MSVVVRKNKRKAETPQKNRVRVTPAIQASVAKLLSLFPAHNDQFVAPVFDKELKLWRCDKVEVLATTFRDEFMIWRRSKMQRDEAEKVFGSVDSKGIRSHYFNVSDLINVVLDYITLPAAYASSWSELSAHWVTDSLDIGPSFRLVRKEGFKPENGVCLHGLYRSYTAGNGLFATEDLVPGTIIGPYLGEIKGATDSAYAFGNNYCLCHWVEDDSVTRRFEFSIDGTPRIPELQVVSYANEPTPEDVTHANASTAPENTANCSLVFGIIPGIDLRPLYLVVTNHIKAGCQLTTGYGKEYHRTYPVGVPSDVLVSPVILSFEQSMQVVHLYGLFNPGLEECVRAVFASSSSSSAAAAASDE